jgi:hypothetical protein
MSELPLPRIALGAALGLIAGVILGRELDEGFGTASMILMVVFAGLGSTAAWMQSRARPVEASTPAPVRPATDAHAAVRSEANNEYPAAEMRNTSGHLRSIRVRSRTAPLSAAGLELRLVVEDFDSTSRVTLMEGWYERQGFQELLERVSAEIGGRLPGGSTRAPTLGGYRSESPVDANGFSPLGWTFFFGDATSGLHVTATLSPRDVVLHFRSQATWHRSTSPGLVMPSDVMRHLHAALPDTVNQPVLMRVWLPVNVALWLSPEASPNPTGVIADLDPTDGTFMNLTALREHGLALFPVGLHVPAEVWISGNAELAPDQHAATVRDILEAMKAEKLPAWQRAARSLLATLGPVAPLALEERLQTEEDADTRRRVVHLLGTMPTSLAAAVLHRCLPLMRYPANRQLAETYLRNRRQQEGGAVEEMLDSLDHDALQAAMGYGTPLLVPMRSVWDARVELVQPLVDLGLREAWAHVLVGDRPLPLSVHFRGPGLKVQAMLSSVPLPVPCHVLHLHGPGAEAFREGLHRSGLQYDVDEIQADACSGSPHRAHRGALYLAALSLPCAKGSAPLIEAVRKGRSDANLRRAILRALEFSPDIEAISHVHEASESAEQADAEVARMVLRRWHERGIIAQGPKTAALPAMVLAVGLDTGSTSTV